MAVAGAPYDTLEEVIGKRDSHGMGSIKDFGIEYREVPVCYQKPCKTRYEFLFVVVFSPKFLLFQLAEDGSLDWDALRSALRPHTKCALIQRSCGYSWRQSLSVDEIGKAIKIIKVWF